MSTQDKICEATFVTQQTALKTRKALKLKQLKEEDQKVRKTWLGGAYFSQEFPFYYQPYNFNYEKRCWTARLMYRNMRMASENIVWADRLNPARGCIRPIQKDCSHELMRWGKHCWRRGKLRLRLAWLKELQKSELTDDLIYVLFSEWL